MKRILFIHSSLFGNDSASTQIARSLVERLGRDNPGTEVTRIDLADDALPHLGAAEFNSWTIDPGQRDKAQRALAHRSDTLIDQLMSHDTLVLAVPMYNLGIPSTLKAWIDRVARAGKTFAYTSEGPTGLVKSMQAYLVFARGGNYRGTPLDTQTSYLASVLGLMGIENIDTIFAEGLSMGDDSRESSLASAMDEVSRLTTSNKEVQYAVA